MKKNQTAAAAAAILGLAFCGDSTAADEPTSRGGDLFSAVDNTAIANPAVTSTDEQSTASASGAALEGAAAITGNANTVGVANTVFNACIGGLNNGTAFGDDCAVLVIGGTEDPANASAALASLTPDQVLATRTVALAQVDAGLGVAAMRMGSQRLASGLSGFAPNGTMAAGLLFGQASGGGASGDLQFGRGGAFFNLKYLNTEQDRDTYTSGYDLDGLHLTLGGDYRVRENLILGLYGSYTTESVDYRQNKGDMEMDGWGIGAYGTYYWEGGAFVEGTLGYNRNEYDLRRRIAYGIASDTDGKTIVRQTATSSPEADVLYASLGGGYTIDRQSFTITPSASLNYTENAVDAYRETMSNPQAAGGSLAIGYDSQTYTSLTSRLGVMVAKAISSGSGVFLPQLSLDWVHEFQNDQETLDARFVNDLSNTPLLVTTSRPDHNYFDLGLGISGQFAQGRSAFISVNTLLGYEDVTSYSITGGFRIEF
ncbi:autotransporter outer membrane beta-barrel domain-containing protein [Thiocystis violascens]|uniref:Autotransporter protein or domain, integral membrane beta-barrel involved in protein secretion n=1 Tax=Thiocystis violascens (strain ATCC 17096 / DSM 198 / 6111) TaxID=765911 RepID=I3YH62_THIV6|nr:autotransporter outer membrane beta-barrel domain-containing protein [Thiocystis violascens]AFL76330.1 autotransporter protein or domain, integral membrane beta-barrel involved in protein secretion [Thiocystis violascens DSM 198]